jgi:Acetyltransferase (GNAT) domain
MRETARLVLTPVGAEHAADLFILHSDPSVAYWSDAWSPGASGSDGRGDGAAMASRWCGEVDRLPMVQRRLLRRCRPSLAMVDGKRQLELGLGPAQRAARGLGLATEIGRAGLDYMFDVPGQDAAVSITEVHNRATRAVMERPA